MNKNDFNSCLWDKFTVDVKPYIPIDVNIFIRMSIQENDKFLSEDYFWIRVLSCKIASSLPPRKDKIFNLSQITQRKKSSSYLLFYIITHHRIINQSFQQLADRRVADGHFTANL